MRSAWVTMTLLLAFAFTEGAVAAPPPAEAFGNLPQTSDPVLTGDGHLLAWQDESGSVPQVVILDVDNRKIVRQIELEAEAKLREVRWADNGTLLVTTSFALHGDSARQAHHFEWFRILAVDVNSGEKHLLMEKGSRAISTGITLVSVHASKPNTVLVASPDFVASRVHGGIGTHIATKGSPFVNNLFAVDTRTGDGTVIAEGNPFVVQWTVDLAGNPVARSEWHAEGKVFGVYRRDGSSWKEILHREGQNPMVLKPVSADGRTVSVSGPNEQGRITLWSVPLDGAPPTDLLPDVKEDIEQFSFDPNTAALRTARIGGLHPKVHWFDQQAQQLAERASKPFPHKDVFVRGHSDTNNRVLVMVTGSAAPPVYYLIDFDSHKADIVGEAYPLLADVDLGTRKAVMYAARDGTQIPAILTLPPKVDDKNLPMVVLVHGGPAGHDSTDFDWWAQFLASRGYAVLQPQFRGSTGYGTAFERAGHGQWGGLMQDDVTDGVNALVTQGVADAKRVCIVGASYGGYAALAGVTLTPQLYACAVSINGISDLVSMQGYIKEHFGMGALDGWREELGTLSSDKLAAKSPARLAEQIRVPVMLMHSADDTVVPQTQTDAMAKALQGVGAKVTLVTLEGDDHWFSRGNTRMQMLKELDTFLASNLR
jgi:dienelactone hydrolase